MPDRALWYVYAVIAGGFAALAVSLGDGIHIASPLTFSIYLALAILASLCKVRLPGMEGTYSLNTLFIVFGLYYLSPGETTIAGCAAVIVQSLWRPKQRPIPLQVFFNIANVALSIATAFAVTGIALLHGAESYRPAVMAAAAFVQFTINTLVVSGVLSLLQGKSVLEIWACWYEWSFPWYLVAAALAGMLPVGGIAPKPEAWIILLPLLYLVHFFYGLTIAGNVPAIALQASLPGNLSRSRGQVYLSAVLALGGVLLGRVLVSFDAVEPERFLAYLALGLVVSTWKVRMPGVPATISVGFVVTLLAIEELPLSQALLISALNCCAQVLWKPKQRPSPVHAIFSVASLVIGTAFAHGMVKGGVLPDAWTLSIPASLAISTAVLFGVNTLLISAAISLTAGNPLRSIWKVCCFWSFSFYLAGACATGLMVTISRAAGWQPSVLILPMMGLVYLSYRTHVQNAVARSAMSADLVAEPAR